MKETIGVLKIAGADEQIAAAPIAAPIAEHVRWCGEVESRAIDADYGQDRIRYWGRESDGLTLSAGTDCDDIDLIASQARC